MLVIDIPIKRSKTVHSEILII